MATILALRSVVYIDSHFCTVTTILSSLHILKRSVASYESRCRCVWLVWNSRAVLVS